MKTEEIINLIKNYTVRKKDYFINYIIADYINCYYSNWKLYSYGSFINLLSETKNYYNNIDLEQVIQIIQKIKGNIQQDYYILNNAVYSKDELINLFIKDYNFIQFVENEHIYNGELILKKKKESKNIKVEEKLEELGFKLSDNEGQWDNEQLGLDVYVDRKGKITDIQIYKIWYLGMPYFGVYDNYSNYGDYLIKLRNVLDEINRML